MANVDDFDIGEDFFNDDFGDLLSEELPADGFNYLVGANDGDDFNFNADSWEMEMDPFPFNDSLGVPTSTKKDRSRSNFLLPDEGNFIAAAKSSKGSTKKSTKAKRPSKSVEKQKQKKPQLSEKKISEEKRKRRLERNRESARQSRRRKKQYLELLEEKVEQLTSSLNTLRRDHLGVSAKHFRLQRNEALKALNSMRSLSNIHSNDPVLEKRVDQIVNQFGPNTDHRKGVLEYYFRSLNGTLLPPYSRFLLWMVNQGEDFFSDFGPSHRARSRLTQQKVVASTLTGEMRMEEFTPGTGDKAAESIEQAAKAAAKAAAEAVLKQKPRDDAGKEGGKVAAGGRNGKSGMGSLWPLISNELGLTYDQEEKMKSTFIALNTPEHRAQRERLYSIVHLLSKLGESALKRSPIVHSLTKSFHDVLTPVQSARFFLWVEQNRTLIHECGLDHLLASGVNFTNAQKRLVVQSAARQFVGRAAQDLNIKEMRDLLTSISQN